MILYHKSKWSWSNNFSKPSIAKSHSSNNNDAYPTRVMLPKVWIWSHIANKIFCWLIIASGWSNQRASKIIYLRYTIIKYAKGCCADSARREDIIVLTQLGRLTLLRLRPAVEWTFAGLHANQSSNGGGYLSMPSETQAKDTNLGRFHRGLLKTRESKARKS